MAIKRKPKKPGNPHLQDGDHNKLSFDIRGLRKRILATFDEVGGEAKLKQWAEDHFDRFMLEIVLPLLPKHVDGDGMDIGKDRNTDVSNLSFDRGEFNKYLEEAERGGVVGPARHSKNNSKSA